MTNHSQQHHRPAVNSKNRYPPSPELIPKHRPTHTPHPPATDDTHPQARRDPFGSPTVGGGVGFTWWGRGGYRLVLGSPNVGWVGSLTVGGVGADRDQTPTGGVPTRPPPCIHIRCVLDVWFCWAVVGRLL